jgi:hypothetical protein
MAKYILGEPIRIEATFRNDAGALADPTAINVRVRKWPLFDLLDEIVYTWPVASVPPVIRDSVGEFHLDLTADVEGPWRYRVEGTGAVVDVEEALLQVKTDFS